eukprot:CAMPEP_0197040382 /NCGR_PEP_ID=MMETSP1384-20130603/17090_1 /TAXON_ID=29189 /ORGANISM="Ammonia sp." /LENGTH=555 /DNA_ID=CAMNT_0042471125 /DNA_START=100 /DNA_END=1767 /DNA_ORIENTATION=-
MSDQAIDINADLQQVEEFNNNMHEMFYSSRPDYNECALRCKVLNLFNEIWQQYLIEKEQNAMINKSNPKYSSLIKDDSFIEIQTLETRKIEPYRKREGDLDSSPPSSSEETKSFTPPPSNSSRSVCSQHKKPQENLSDRTNFWCTPIQGNEKLIIIREYEQGPIIKRVLIPCVMIFGSIAFGLDGIGSDMDVALPASIDNPEVHAHSNSQLQAKLLKIFQQRLNLASRKCKALGLKFKVERILHARVPILKLTELALTKGALSIDVGLRSTQMPITKLIRYYVDYDERVPVFYNFIKRWSKTRQISEAMWGYPNSFGFVMLVTKFLQLLEEPLIPIMEYDRHKKQLVTVHSIDKFRANTQTLIELAAAFFDYFFNFDFEAYQIDITTCGLQWKHSQDYNINHADQGTMLIEDPSVKTENVTRCLKPYNLKVMKEEFFRAYKCTVNGDWQLLFAPFSENNKVSIFEIYPPENDYEQEIMDAMEIYDGEEFEFDDDELFHHQYRDTPAHHQYRVQLEQVGALQSKQTLSKKSKAKSHANLKSKANAKYAKKNTAVVT